MEILGLSTSHSQSGSFALVLEEGENLKRLPIIIGMFEARAIAIEMEKIVSKRPMTHDLFKSISLSFGIEIKQIIISDLKEGVFYAKLVCKDKSGKRVELDARPSDAIAIGIRFDAPIYATKKVMDEASIDMSDVEQEEAETNLGQETENIKAKKVNTVDLSVLNEKSIEELQQMIQQAVTEENYEKAAKIRDEISKR